MSLSIALSLALALAPERAAGWQDQVVRLGRDPFVLDLAATEDGPAPERPMDTVTELIEVRHADPTTLADLLAPMLGAGGGVVARPGWVVIRETPAALERLRVAVVRLDRGHRQVVLEAAILNVSLDEGHTTGVDWEALTGVDYRGLGASTDLATVTRGAATGARLDRSLARVAQEGLAGPAGGLSVGVVKNGVSALVRAIATENDVKVVSHPRVLVVEGQQAYIHVGERLGYRTSTTTQTVTVEEVRFLDTGTVLRFTARAVGGGRVRLGIAPSQSTGSIDAQGLPNEKLTEVETEAALASGETVVIGGLIDEQEENTQAGVPFLRSVPLVGRLFSRTERTRRRQEIVITVTPQVLEEEGGPDHEDGDEQGE
ncbi:MAG: hypothetical protein HY722_01935 [Planctomycetes bacterium]|nr:hypothetical protein [Planctomycetota bacterium]